MERVLHMPHGVIFVIIALLFTASTSFFSFLNPVGAVVGIVALIFPGFLIISYLFPHSSKIENILLAPLASLTLYVPFIAVIYYLFGITTISAFAALCLPFCITYFFQKQSSLPTIRSIDALRAKGSLVLTASFLLFTIIHWGILLSNQTTHAVLGPWDVAPPLLFVNYFLMSLALIGFMKRHTTVFSSVFLTLYALSTVSAALVLIPLGIGFDPHLHQATERYIVANGSIEPKQLYYLGHYGLIAWLSKLLSVDVSILDQLLIPVLAALSLPILVTRTMREAFRFSGSSVVIAAFLFIILTLSFAISTTPWSLAVLLSVVCILCNLLFISTKSNALLFAGWTSAGATLLVHPLAGIPLVGITAIGTLLSKMQKSQSIKILTITSLSLLVPVGIPLAFLFASATSPELTVTLSCTQPNLSLFLSNSGFSSRFFAPLDFTYFWLRHTTLLLSGAGIIGLYLLWRHGFRRHAGFLAAGFATFTVSGLLLSGCIQFPSLIAYEQSVYAARLFFMGSVALFPAALYTGVYWGKRLYARLTRLQSIAVWLLLAGIATASFYGSYPRNDGFTSYHGYTISTADLDAVRHVNINANGEPYIVLSNQVVAAAAIKEFGFQKYFEFNSKQYQAKKVFYYPVPTTSPLAEAYRNFLEDYDPKHLLSAMDAVGVSRGYIIVPAYEPRFRNIIDAQSRYDIETLLQNERIAVYRYKKNAP